MDLEISWRKEALRRWGKESLSEQEVEVAGSSGACGWVKQIVKLERYGTGKDHKAVGK